MPVCLPACHANAVLLVVSAASATVQVNREPGGGRPLGDTGDRPEPVCRTRGAGPITRIFGLTDVKNVGLAREFRTDVIAILDHRYFA